jgi:hypothetical protein
LEEVGQALKALVTSEVVVLTLSRYEIPRDLLYIPVHKHLKEKKRIEKKIELQPLYSSLDQPPDQGRNI